MVNEYEMIAVMALCGSLFAIGGTHEKLYRRLGIPLLLSCLSIFHHILWWKTAAFGLTLYGVLSLGYGSKTPYWEKSLVFALYGISFLWIGWTWWVVLTPLICLAVFALSNWKPLAKEFFWKFCEFSMGLLLAVTFISAL